VYLLREKIFVEKTSILFGCILILFFVFLFFFLLGEQLPKNWPTTSCLALGKIGFYTLSSDLLKNIKEKIKFVSKNIIFRKVLKKSKDFFDFFDNIIIIFSI